MQLRKQNDNTTLHHPNEYTPTPPLPAAYSNTRPPSADAPEFHSEVARMGLQDHRLGRGAGQGRGLHEQGTERRVEEDTVVVKPL